MQVYHSLEELPFIGNAAITIGNFDGVHLGHAKIFNNLVKEHVHGFQSMVMTFWPHPRTVLRGDKEMRFLTSMEEKAQLLREIGIQHLLIVPFTKEFSEISAGDFVEQILERKIGVKKILLGYDHHFGKSREGNIHYLSKLAPQFGYLIEEIPKQEIDHLAISSSQIRKFLEDGQPELASHLLGRNYSMEGTVVQGNKLGRTIGFPTANLKLTFPQKLIPRRGVYAVYTQVASKSYQGMMNIGIRPTVDGLSLTLEVNIFNFSDSIYGETISVEFVKYLREEQKFPSIEALKEQLGMDKKEATLVLN